MVITGHKQGLLWRRLRSNTERYTGSHGTYTYSFTRLRSPTSLRSSLVNSHERLGPINLGRPYGSLVNERNERTKKNHKIGRTYQQESPAQSDHGRRPGIDRRIRNLGTVNFGVWQVRVEWVGTEKCRWTTQVGHESDLKGVLEKNDERVRTGKGSF